MTRRVAIALALLGVAALVTSTAGFSSTIADRDVRVAVADDDDALVGVDQQNRSLRNGVHENETLLVLRNQFDDGPLAVSNIRVAESDDPRPPKVENVSVASGGGTSTKEIVADIKCANNTNNAEVFTVSAIVSANDGEVSVHLSRDVQIACTGKPAGTNSTRTTDGG